MPVRSLSSSVLTWPRRDVVVGALTDWAATIAHREPRLLRVGYFGSYARGNEGVGSDLDVVLVVANDDKPPISRPVDWNLSSLPVPVDLLVYTRSEWAACDRAPSMLFDRIRREIVWVHTKP